MSRQERRYPRTARLNEVLHEVLADELERMSDPRLEMVTITGVEVSSDLAHATVYYSALGDASGDGTLGPVGDADGAAGAALASAASHLRAVLGRSVRVRNVPRLHFAVDPGIVRGDRIEAILRELHRDDAVDEDRS